MKYVVISLIVFFSAACSGNKNLYFSEQGKEDANAKELLQIGRAHV